MHPRTHDSEPSGAVDEHSQTSLLRNSQLPPACEAARGAGRRRWVALEPLAGLLMRRVLKNDGLEVAGVYVHALVYVYREID